MSSFEAMFKVTFTSLFQSENDTGNQQNRNDSFNNEFSEPAELAI